MKLDINQYGGIQLSEVYNTLTLITDDGEQLAITMRDSGFEFNYQGEWYFAKEGYLEPFHKSPRDNYSVSELQHHTEDSVYNSMPTIK